MFTLMGGLGALLFVHSDEMFCCDFNADLKSVYFFSEYFL